MYPNTTNADMLSFLQDVDPNPLSQDHMYGGNLSNLEYIGTGLSCAYVRLDVNKRCDRN